MLKTNTPNDISLQRHLWTVLVLIIVLFFGVGGWAGTQKIASAAISSGTVTVEGNLKKVQHQTGGILNEISVGEGDHVEAGQTLFVLDDKQLRASMNIIETTLAQLYAKQGRLRAEILDSDKLVIDAEAPSVADTDTFRRTEAKQLESRQRSLAAMKAQLRARQTQMDVESAGIDVQLSAIDETLRRVTDEIAIQSRLLARRAVSADRLNQLERERVAYQGERGKQIASKAETRGRRDELALQILQLDEDRRSENTKDLAEAEAAIAENLQRRAATREQLSRLTIVAPTSGRILQLNVHTIGGVVSAGDVLATVVPDDQRMVVETRVQAHDIDQLHIGQIVMLRFTAFNQRTTPEISGRITNIAPDIITDPTTRAMYYPIKIEPNPESLDKLGKLHLYPGMPAEAFAEVSERSIISYLIKPIVDQAYHAMRED